MNTRRSLLKAVSIGVAATAGMAGAAQAKEKPMKNLDPELKAIERRLMDLPTRGTHLSKEQKYLVLFAAATAQALPVEMKRIVKMALKDKVDPVFIKEVVYHCAPYVGIGRVETVLPVINKEMEKAGIALPLPKQGTVTDADRFEKGLAVQTWIFGEAIKKMHEGATSETRPIIVEDLSAYCFGDFYTRNGLSIKDRELVVFCALTAMGGCESQLKGHIAANIKEGNDKQTLFDALHVAIPLNGFPRTLNSLALVTAA